MSYSVKEIYYTLHGEGFHAGTPSVFCRFAGCNLWSGLEQDRATAICDFCDTDFVGTNGPGGGKFKTAEPLAAAVLSKWPQDQSSNARVVCTGGEPLLQIDDALVEAFHKVGLEIHVETNGTIRSPRGVDWLCVSPKAGADCIQRTGDELKIVFPQPGIDPADWTELDFRHFYLQPMDGAQFDENLRATTEYCLRHPRWRVSLQQHKFLGLP